jgi:hypothetical protein
MSELPVAGLGIDEVNSNGMSELPVAGLGKDEVNSFGSTNTKN